MSVRIVILLCCTLVLPCLQVNAQFTDNFSDGNFTQNPTWTGDAALFSVENFQLRLNAVSGNDSSFLVTPSQAVHNTEWSFWMRLAFTPTNNNHPKIYLVSNSSNLRGALNGYYLQVGKDGTGNKRLYFFRQDGMVRTEIMAGSDNLAPGTNNLLRIKVLRDQAGKWEFFADPTGSQLYAPQGSVSDATYTQSAWFGIFCKYTSTNIRNFYFDDFYVGDIRVDTILPTLSAVRTLSANELEIMFSEAVTNASATNILNYSVNQNIGNPASVVSDPLNPARFRLQFSMPFTSAQTYVLSIQGITDLAGNTMLPAAVGFSYYLPVAFDVLITEIMADPTPVVGLPEHEYFELFNRTNFPVNLSGWAFQHGTTQRDLPGVTIPPGGYLILGTEAATQALTAYGQVAAISGLSATALTNTGTRLTLYDPARSVIHSVNYLDTWYQSAIKKEGGWSLEMIDTNNPCGEAGNWVASRNLAGGTPGTENSVRAENPDLEAPTLVNAVILNATTLYLTFSETMQANGVSNPASYFVNLALGKPLMVVANEPANNAVSLVFENNFSAQTIYELSIVGELRDCAGNLMKAGSTTRFAIAENPAPDDLIINEILFNPPTGGKEYVEIYNRSQKVIDLRNVRLASQDTILNQLTSIREITTTGYLIFPEDYLVLTADPDLVKKFFYTPNPKGFIKMASVPLFANTSGIVVLCDPNQTILDRLVYQENMQFPLLKIFKGVALERLDPNRPANDKTNWHSASSTVGYGTPAYKNSQFLVAEAGSDPFSLSPDIFSPDNDSYNDVLNITWTLPEPGYVASITIYDANGRTIRRLVQNQLLGTEGTYSWNGITDSNEKAPIGYYVVFIELFDLKGNLKQYKKTTVLGGRL